eukprot:TRINITY_DN13336_c0_g3_i1.p1 TRINITY_DN13336_c0_g3~~TRINITY_DN13336_c0_g3_i1.p1  ORF type:complete len:418 (+),score=17.86 TRINITY_DN13336_c0_g3_i1:47-1300(+)
MLHRLVTSNRLSGGSTEDGEPLLSNMWTPATMCCGFCLFAFGLTFVYCSELDNVQIHLALDSVEATEVFCETDANVAPVGSVVHLACPFSVEQGGVAAVFEGFEDIVAPSVRRQQYAWTKLQVQHLTPNRRRSSGSTWQDVYIDGHLKSEVRTAKTVKVGPYSLADDMILRIPAAAPLQIQAPLWQRQGLPAPIEQPSYGTWILNSSTMAYAEDCQCLWAGRTRVLFYGSISGNEMVSVIGRASSASSSSASVPHAPIISGASLTGNEDVEDAGVGAVELGSVPASTMLADQLSAPDFMLWIRRLVECLMFICAAWCMIWPITAMTCLRDFCKDKNGQDPCGDCGLPLATRAFNADRGGSTLLRASLLGITVAVVTAFAGWIGFRYSALSAVLIIVVACGVNACFEVSPLEEDDGEE